ncbi:MAG: intein-containing RctB family protein [Candidatus Bathyarchaeia archaeon]
MRSQNVPLRKIGDYAYEIPRYKPEMRVPGRVYADEGLLNKMKQDLTLRQCANVAWLPGIYKYSITLPDGHQGYGFPIGGVAAFDAENGVISPGGIGYDINCLSGDAQILSDLGYRIPIKELESRWRDELVTCMDFDKNTKTNTPIVRYIRILPKNSVYSIKTESGRQVIATEDHPFWTPKGMVCARDLKRGSKVAVFPFEGVPYVRPNDDIIVDEDDVRSLGGCIRVSEGMMRELRERDLIPLRLSDPRTPILAKLTGYITGDGAIFFTGRKGFSCFYGKAKDLEKIRADIKRLNYTPSKVYKRTRGSVIKGRYGVKKFTSTSCVVKVSASSFASLLVALGAPIGTKTETDFSVPAWIQKAPRWIARLYLASLFGAELTKPKPVYNYNFYCPILSMNKTVQHLASGLNFLRGVSSLLKGLGVRTGKISKGLEGRNRDGDQIVRLRLLISSKPRNLIRFWSTVGYEYNSERSSLANVAVHFLRLKERVMKERVKVARVARELRRRGASPSEVYRTLSSRWANKRFLERWLYRKDRIQPRVPQSFPTFQDFVSEHTLGLGGSGMVWDTIEEKERINHVGSVYDFTVQHNTHNFIANGFVVSNCGVRLLRTDLASGQVDPLLGRLLDRIFDLVPCGVGRRGKIRLSSGELNAVLQSGVEWAIDHGYGWSEDSRYLEENGRMDGADPDKVSPRAKERGAPQLGTLGAGNHFLEIQRVDKIYNERVAKIFNLPPEGGVAVMIHCGSRGLGHQVCGDYIRVMERAVHKYKIRIPDRELCCAPFHSREGEDYFAAMACAVNFAFCNRHMIMHWVREAFEGVFGTSAEDLGIRLVYGVCHNVGKREVHKVNGERREAIVHRKGATRAFPPDHPDLPADYRSVGQPVIIPGSMGTASYVLVGTERGKEIAWSSTAHGSGRVMSRMRSRRSFRAEGVERRLRSRGILVKAASMRVVSEEAPEAYKNIDTVANVSHAVGIATKVARLVPLGVVKG